MVKISQALRAFTQSKKKTYTPKEKELVQEVQQELTEKKFPKVKKFYPIYSDNPNAWQADLTFLRETELLQPPPHKNRWGGYGQIGIFKKIHDDNESYAEEQTDPYTHVQRKKAILCLVNVNTRYAFARLTKFKSDAELKTAENHIKNSVPDIDNNTLTLESKPGEKPVVVNKGKRKNIPIEKGGSIRTSGAVRDALIEINKDMKETQSEIRSWGKKEKDPMAKATFHIGTLYVDEGPEFQDEFKKYCVEKKIDLVTFKPSRGTKRRLGIVERFNRTLKRLIQVHWALQMKKKGSHDTLEKTLPVVLREYNTSMRHRSLASFVGKNEGVKRLPGKTTPLQMHTPGLEMEDYVPYKKKETDDTDKYYADKLALMKVERDKRPNIRYFLQVRSDNLKEYGDKFQRRGRGTLSKVHRLSMPHLYRIRAKPGQPSTYHKAQYSKSFKIEGSSFRVLPYDIILT